ncbi:MAG TPA: hypothetical protein PLW21_05355 [Methanothrix sp.]|nr:hypothetical protein [Methanothrix sp.]
MNWKSISAILILSLVGCVGGLDTVNGLEMRPGEAAAERMFERGFGEPWIGGDPPSMSSYSYGSYYQPRVRSWWYDPFNYYSYQGKTYHPYRYYYYHYPGYSWYYPYAYRSYWYPYYSPYWWY